MHISENVNEINRLNLMDATLKLRLNGGMPYKSETLAAIFPSHSIDDIKNSIHAVEELFRDAK